MPTVVSPPDLVSDANITATEQFGISTKEELQALGIDPLVERVQALESEIQRIKDKNSKLAQDHALLKAENNRLLQQCGALTNKFASKVNQKDDKLYELYEATKELLNAFSRYHLLGFGENITTPENPEEITSWINTNHSKIVSIIAGKDELNNEVYGKSSESGKARAKPKRKSILIKCAEDEVKIKRRIERLEQQNNRKCTQVVKNVEKINSNHERLDEELQKLEKVRKIRQAEEAKLAEAKQKLNEDTFTTSSKLEDMLKASSSKENDTVVIPKENKVSTANSNVYSSNTLKTTCATNTICTTKTTYAEVLGIDEASSNTMPITSFEEAMKVAGDDNSKSSKNKDIDDKGITEEQTKKLQDNTPKNKGTKKNGLKNFTEQVLIVPEITNNSCCLPVEKKNSNGEDVTEIENARISIMRNRARVNQTLHMAIRSCSATYSTVLTIRTANNEDFEINATSTPSIQLCDSELNPITKLNSPPSENAAAHGTGECKRSPLLPKISKKDKRRMKKFIKRYGFSPALLDLLIELNGQLVYQPYRLLCATQAEDLYSTRPLYVSSYLSEGLVLNFLMFFGFGRIPKSRIYDMLKSLLKIDISKKSLINVMISTCRDFLHDIATNINKKILTENKHVGIDETTVLVRQMVWQGLVNNHAYCWNINSGPNEANSLSAYLISDNRSYTSLDDFIKQSGDPLDSTIVSINCDSHKAYDSAIREIPILGGVVLARCWQHASRRFVSCLRASGHLKTYQQFFKQCDGNYELFIKELLNLTAAYNLKQPDHQIGDITLKQMMIYHCIRALFKLDRLALDPKAPQSLRENLRGINQKAIVDKVIELCKDLIKQDPSIKISQRKDGSYYYSGAPAGVWGAAASYLLNNEHDLRTFLTDCDIPCSNNASEVEIKSPCILRRTSLFLNSIDGAFALCDLLTIIQSCIRNNVNPMDFIAWVITNKKLRLEMKRIDAGITTQICHMHPNVKPLKTEKEIADFILQYGTTEYMARANLYRPDNKSVFDEIYTDDLTIENFKALMEAETPLPEPESVP